MSQHFELAEDVVIFIGFVVKLKKNRKQSSPQIEEDFSNIYLNREKKKNENLKRTHILILPQNFNKNMQ